MTDLLAYLPEYYVEIIEFAELAEAENREIDALKAAIDQVLDDQFVQTASLSTIRRRESMLGIQADPALESPAFRRSRLINRYSVKPPFTIRYLQQRLDALAGAGLTSVSVDPAQYLLRVTVAIDDADVFREILRTVEIIKPANLVYQQNTSIQDVIGIEEHISKYPLFWQTVLGNWELGAVPYATLGTEEVIK